MWHRQATEHECIVMSKGMSQASVRSSRLEEDIMVLAFEGTPLYHGANT
jgi:hypothetical protein